MKPHLIEIVLLFCITVVSSLDMCPCSSLKDISVSCPYRTPDGNLSKPRQYITAYNLFLSQSKSDSERLRRAEIWRNSKIECRKEAQLALDLKVQRQRFLHYEPPKEAPKNIYALDKYKF